MRVVFYALGTLCLLLAYWAFSLLHRVAVPPDVDFDILGVLHLFMTGPRVLLFLVVVVFAVAGIACFIAPHLPRYKALR
jgi:hypothetical protein